VSIPNNPFWLYYIFAALIAFPVVRVFRRAGLRTDYAALLAIPLLGLACCCAVLALSPWPNMKKKGG
jgi:hypothetical protein